MCANNLPRVALDSGAAGIRTRDLLIASPAPYRSATETRLRCMGVISAGALHDATGDRCG